jgi:DNA-directed RNA polymerase specialized sigma24 family protein
MDEPCCSLLDKFYWEELSGEEIARQMNYKNADTVKTQKYKCMQKLKVALTGVLKSHNLW